MITKKTKKLVYKELDGTLSEKESLVLKESLQNSAELRQYHREASEIREAVKSSAVTSFKPYFEERLMNALAGLSNAEDRMIGLANSLIFSFRRVVFTAVIILGLLVSYNVTSGNYHSILNILGSSETNIEYAFSPLQNLTGSDK